MIYVFEVGYTREGYNLVTCVKEVQAKDAKDGEKKIRHDIPEGMGIRHIALVGSRKTSFEK